MPSKENTDETMLHGTALVLRAASYPPAAVFLRGISGSGKSDLAFRLIHAEEAMLVSDDQVTFKKRLDKIYAESVSAIHGLMEVRGVGLIHVPVEREPARLRLVIDLVRPEEVPRLPDWTTTAILGVEIPRLKLHAFEISAALKIRLALDIVHDPKKAVP